MIVLRRRVKVIIQAGVAFVLVVFVLFAVSTWNTFSHRELDDFMRGQHNNRRRNALIPGDGVGDTVQLLTDAFTKADANSDKLLTSEEIETWIVDRTQEHLNGGEEELAKMFVEADKDQSGYASWEEFALWFRRHPAQHGKTSLEDHKEEWGVADSNHDKMLDRHEFLCFRHPELCKETLRQLTQDVIKNLDKNSDGKLTEDEYIAPPPGQVEEGFQDYEDKFKDQRKREFAVVDKDKNGIATEDELNVFLDPRNHIHAKTEAEELIDAADDNDDGRLSLEEVMKHKDLFEQSKLMDVGETFHNDF
ncbi:putative 45 kDa calcium-binding protein [Hypsibius exemplaris]|uniref:45 kDa calcium-binding protein n=1 Tax=Hypsibius exemplaris TaxID=2072580 RepID=A0A9X6NIA6_HYPEX|nr:putative 45 kDa calcium-binding protein [Hypsibius exemplaris]